jgi:hypothetical protein
MRILTTQQCRDLQDRMRAATLRIEQLQHERDAAFDHARELAREGDRLADLLRRAIAGLRLYDAEHHANLLREADHIFGPYHRLRMFSICAEHEGQDVTCGHCNGVWPEQGAA